MPRCRAWSLYSGGVVYSAMPAPRSPRSTRSRWLSPTDRTAAVARIGPRTPVAGGRRRQVEHLDDDVHAGAPGVLECVMAASGNATHDGDHSVTATFRPDERRRLADASNERGDSPLEM